MGIVGGDDWTQQGMWLGIRDHSGAV